MRRITKRISLLLLFIFPFLSCKFKYEKSTTNTINTSNEILTKDKKTQIEVKKLKYSDLPNQIKPDGFFLHAAKWKDLQGENYLIIYRIGPNLETEFLESNNEKYAKLYIKQYILKDEYYSELWKTVDFVRNCSYDIWIGLSSEESFYITDLNNNGISETSFVYYVSCRSDTSPSEMKLIMREGSIKFALRGTTILKPYLIDINLENFQPKIDQSLIGNNDSSTSFLLNTMGKYISDEDFSNNPKMLDFARKKWLENMVEKKTRQLQKQ